MLSSSIRKALLSLSLGFFSALGASPLSLPGMDQFADTSAPFNLSGVSQFERGGARFLALASDEGSEFALVRVSPDPKLFLFNLAELSKKRLEGKPSEIDLEGAAVRGNRLYLMGSASLKRKKPRGKRLSQDLDRLATLVPGSGGSVEDPVPHTNQLYVLELKFEGSTPKEPSLEACVNLRQVLEKDRHIAPFLALPSKDNGLDFEGLAVTDEKIYLGARGPVLRGNATVLCLDKAVVDQDHFDADFRAGKTHHKVFFLYLKGFGIRAMEAAADGSGSGVLLVSGPTMTQPGPFELYTWNGQDHALSAPIPGAVLRPLGRLPVPDPRAKLEGLFRGGDKLGLLFDGPKGGAIQEIPWPPDPK